MSVIGIDLGNDGSCIAQAKRGGIDIIRNENSKYTTPSLVSFQGKQRFMGEHAVPLLRTNYRNTISEIKRFIGRRFSEPEVQAEIPFLPYRVVQLPEDRIGIQVEYNDEPRVFTPEAITAMVLQNLKSIVEDSGTTARDVVLSVPPYWTDVQRRAMLDAADIVGLNVLRLMNDSTAVALAYGIFRNARNQFHETDSTNVMFVDVGHAASKVCIASFVKDRLVMRSCVCDANVGGRNFDMALVMHMANEFKSKTGLDVLSNHKALIKLKSECEKLKKVLSANSKQSINVECMMEERDFTSMLEREQLETLISPLVDKIVDCVHGALEQAGMTAFDIAAVEVVGGSTRIPLIKQRISEAMGKELSTTLNADEAVARGCALQCAILSPLFKVRDFEIHDIVPYDIRVSWEQESVIPSQDDEDSEPGENSLVIFARNSESPKTRKVAFRRTKPFQIASNYADPQQLPQGAASHLGIYTIEGIHARENEPVPKVKVFFRHNIHGIFSVHRAELVQEIIEDSTEASAKSMDTSGDESHNQPEQNSETTESENKDQAEATEAAEATEPPAKKKKYKREDLSVTGGIVYYTPDEKTNIIDEEARMAQQDRIIAETNEKRNALESYIYDTRNKLLEELQEYSTVEERSVLNTKLDEAENWLYDEGYDTTKSIYSSKLDDLMKLGQPIVQRKAENLERPQVVSELMAAVENYKAFASSQEEKYAHINDEDRSKVLAKCSEVEAWLSDLLNKQSELPPFVDAVLTVSEIRSQAQSLYYLCNPIMNKPKPAPKPKETEAKTEENQDMQDESNEQDGQKIPVEPQENGHEVPVDSMDETS